MTNSTSIAFIGLGVMGGPMTGHLARAGNAVIAWNRSTERREYWQEKWSAEGLAVEIADSPADAVREADVVFTCVGNDDDLGYVLLEGYGILDAMKPGALLVDHTTTSASMARRIADMCKPLDIAFIDAPVSGGQAGAENGQLAIMCGGEDADMQRARSVMDCYAKAIVHVGPVSAGQTAKMANQMCIAGILGGLSEAIRLAQGAGLDLDKTYEAISGGAAQSWQMDNRWATMVKDEFDFGFAIDWMRKDLGFALDEAKRLGLSSPITALVDQFYGDVQAAERADGPPGGRLDTSALISRLPKATDTK